MLEVCVPITAFLQHCGSFAVMERYMCEVKAEISMLRAHYMHCWVTLEGYTL